VEEFGDINYSQNTLGVQECCLRDPHKVLAQQECEKKKKYLDACLEQRKHFTPFVISTDGLLGRKAAKLLKWLVLCLTDKWEQPYSIMHNFVKA
jgi:hypothetical protein